MLPPRGFRNALCVLGWVSIVLDVGGLKLFVKLDLAWVGCNRQLTGAAFPSSSDELSDPFTSDDLAARSVLSSSSPYGSCVLCGVGLFGF